MKVAVVGSREIIIEDLGKYLPENVTEIISGGAIGVDSCAKNYALENNIPYREYLPEYEKYRRNAPLVRNKKIIDACDEALIFWNGRSKGTRSVMNYCEKIGKRYRLYCI